MFMRLVSRAFRHPRTNIYTLSQSCGGKSPQQSLELRLPPQPDVCKKSQRAAGCPPGTLSERNERHPVRKAPDVDDVPPPPFPGPHDTCSSQCPEGWHGGPRGRRWHLCHARAPPGIPTSRRADEHIKKLPH